ncbi:MAG: flagellar basal body rod protein FlgC [bacterium]
MSIKPVLNSFDISAKGMSIQKRKMDLVADNMANTSTTRTENGTPYSRKFLVVENKENFINQLSIEGQQSKLYITNSKHISNPEIVQPSGSKSIDDISSSVETDDSIGEKVYMPEHPDADKEGYVQMPNVNIVAEMVEMISATRGYEANLTAFNASKQIAKDALEI